MQVYWNSYIHIDRNSSDYDHVIHSLQEEEGVEGNKSEWDSSSI